MNQTEGKGERDRDGHDLSNLLPCGKLINQTESKGERDRDRQNLSNLLSDTLWNAYELDGK